MSAYRTAAEIPPPPVDPKTVGLVRANGSHCTCRTPGLLWCWWYDVQAGDRWYCKHGGGWKREHDRSNIVFQGFWSAAPQAGEGP